MEMILFVFVLAMSIIVISSLQGMKKKVSNVEVSQSQSSEELIAINSMLRSQQVNTQVNLQQLAVDVLDVYESNGIRIQSDIIEEVSFNNFNTHKEGFLFIESQRKNWKLESSKSLPKGAY